MNYAEFVITVLMGYILGVLHSTTRKELIEQIHDVKQSLNKPLHHNRSNQKLGAVSTPTQQDILDKENPKLKEERDEMRKAFGEMGVNG